MIIIFLYCFSYKSMSIICILFCIKYGILIYMENMVMVEINIDNLIGCLLEGKNVFYFIFF